MLAEVGGVFFLQQLDPLTQCREVIYDQRKLLGRLAQLLDIILLQPLLWTVE